MDGTGAAKQSPFTPRAVEVASLSEEATREAVLVLQEGDLPSHPGQGTRRPIGGLAAKDAASPPWGGAEAEPRPPLQEPLVSLARPGLPVPAWGPPLALGKLYVDVVAGVAVGGTTVIQGISYAAMAGLPYVYGLHSACMAPLLYGIFGLPHQLALGPAAVASLLVQSGLREVMTQGECPAWFEEGRAQQRLQSEVCPGEYVKLATLTAFCAGVMLVVTYVMKLGPLVSFMGRPVTYGYSTGAAVVIIFSQLKAVSGLSNPQPQILQDTLEAFVQNVPESNGHALGLSIACLAFLVGCDRIARRWKRCVLLGAFAPLCACIVGGLVLQTWPDLASTRNIAHVGSLPQSFMPFIAMQWGLSALPRVLPTAVAICLVGYSEAIAICKATAARRQTCAEPNRELLALGLCSAIGSLFGSYPVMGSRACSSLKLDLKAPSRLSSAIACIVPWCAMLLFTRALSWLPQFVLSAVVISSVLPLCDLQEARKASRVSKLDGLLWVLAFFGVVFMGVKVGIGMAAAASLVIVLHEAARPKLTVLWHMPGTSIYRDIDAGGGGSFVQSIFIVRPATSLFFANAQHVKDMLLTYVDDMEQVNKTEYVVLEMAAVSSIDSTAARMIHDILKEFRHKSIELAFTMVGDHAAKTLDRAGLTDDIGADWFFGSVHEAVRHCLRHRRAKRAQEQKAMEQAWDTRLEVGFQEMGGRHVGFGHEASISNSSHAPSTAVLLALRAGTPTTVGEIAATFQRREIGVISAHVEPAEGAGGGEKHRYPLQKFMGDNLSGEEIEAWRLEVERLPGELAALRCAA